ncbi:MAG: type I restriction enzyme endonuclease domain-containing protein [Gemmatimonadaceae bacterium]
MGRTFEELVDFIQALGDEDPRAVREGLTEEHLAVFDLLCQRDGKLDTRTRETVKAIAVGLLDALGAELARLEDWRSREQARARVRTFSHDFLYDERTGIAGTRLYRSAPSSAVATSVPSSRYFTIIGA